MCVCVCVCVLMDPTPKHLIPHHSISIILGYIFVFTQMHASDTSTLYEMSGGISWCERSEPTYFSHDGKIYCQTNHPSTTNLPISFASKDCPSAPANLCCISPSHQPIPRRMYVHVQRRLPFGLHESSSEDVKVH